MVCVMEHLVEAQTYESVRFENHSYMHFPIAIIIDGKLCNSLSLRMYKNGSSSEADILKQNYGDIEVSHDDFFELTTSDSLLVTCRYFCEYNECYKQLSFPVRKCFFDGFTGPLIYVFTLDNKNNKSRFGHIKKSYKEDYFVYEVEVNNNKICMWSETQIHEIKR